MGRKVVSLITTSYVAFQNIEAPERQRQTFAVGIVAEIAVEKSRRVNVVVLDWGLRS